MLMQVLSKHYYIIKTVEQHTALIYIEYSYNIALCVGLSHTQLLHRWSNLTLTITNYNYKLFI